MQTLYEVLRYIAPFCAFIAFVSIFTPKTVFFFKNPTKKAAFCFWGGLAFLLLLLMSFVFKDEIKQSAKNRESASEQISEKSLVPLAPTSQPTQALTPEQEEKEWQEARANMVKVTSPVQAELKALYAELVAMRGTQNFVELGFSKNNKLANSWKDRVEAFRTRIEKNDDIPLQVRAAPAYLLMLGMGREWRAGRSNADSKWNTQMVDDGINWKLEE